MNTLKIGFRSVANSRYEMESSIFPYSYASYELHSHYNMSFISIRIYLNEKCLWARIRKLSKIRNLCVFAIQINAWWILDMIYENDISSFLTMSTHSPSFSPFISPLSTYTHTHTFTIIQVLIPFSAHLTKPIPFETFLFDLMPPTNRPITQWKKKVFPLVGWRHSYITFFLHSFKW